MTTASEIVEIQALVDDRINHARIAAELGNGEFSFDYEIPVSDDRYITLQVYISHEAVSVDFKATNPKTGDVLFSNSLERALAFVTNPV